MTKKMVTKFCSFALIVLLSLPLVIHAAADSSTTLPPEIQSPEKQIPKKQKTEKQKPKTDDAITAEIQQLYANTPDLNFYGIRVETIDGVVHLYGTVRYYKQRYRAIELAESVAGPESVDATGLYFYRH